MYGENAQHVGNGPTCCLYYSQRGHTFHCAVGNKHISFLVCVAADGRQWRDVVGRVFHWQQFQTLTQNFIHWTRSSAWLLCRHSVGRLHVGWTVGLAAWWWLLVCKHIPPLACHSPVNRMTADSCTNKKPLTNKLHQPHRRLPPCRGGGAYAPMTRTICNLKERR